MLSRDEQVRAAQFRSLTDRQAFIVRRGILRWLLGQYLDREASSIAFAYGRFGKPAVAAQRNDRRLHFNVSRSGALVVYAVTAAGPVGVDVECLRPVPDFRHIASHFFSPLDAGRVLTQPPDRQLDAFFAAWTRTEALMKATGDGIAHGSSRMAAGRAESRPNNRWHFEDLRPAAGYVSTLAHNVRALRLRHWQLASRPTDK
jgi:4'-phosphopantetheinyl transferase